MNPVFPLALISNEEQSLLMWQNYAHLQRVFDECDWRLGSGDYEASVFLLFGLVLMHQQVNQAGLASGLLPLEPP